jgi:glycosyltransferase involved in cell wall biosynthesis
MRTPVAAETPLRIAMIGQKGLPASYGGVEHHVEELGARLAARGHHVTVYCRKNYTTDRRDTYRGMTLRYVPTVATKHLDSIVHSAAATLDTLRGRYDVIHYHAVGPGLLSPVARTMTGAKVVQTIHGLDADRGKWQSGARSVLQTATWMSAHVPHATVVVSRTLQSHYLREFGRDAVYIPNGVNRPDPTDGDHDLDPAWELEKQGYLLFVGRLVPEKAPDLLLESFRGMPGPLMLVLAGGESFTAGFASTLTERSRLDPRVVMPGYVFGKQLASLYRNAKVFVLPSLLEGLPLTLLEAVSFGLPVVASDIPPHLEVLGGDGPGHRIFRAGDGDDLASALRRSLADPAAEQAGARELQSQVCAAYNWDLAVSELEALYRDLGAGRR